MKLFMVIKKDTEDYSVSWTGNYSGISFDFFGIYSTFEKAMAAIDRYFIEHDYDGTYNSANLEEEYENSDISILPYTLDNYIEDRLLAYGNFPSDDY